MFKLHQPLDINQRKSQKMQNGQIFDEMDPSLAIFVKFANSGVLNCWSMISKLCKNVADSRKSAKLGI